MSDDRSTTDRILRLNAVLDRTGLSRSTLYRKMSAGSFPRNIRISDRCAGWRESAITEWMRNPMFYESGGAGSDQRLSRDLHRGVRNVPPEGRQPKPKTRRYVLYRNISARRDYQCIPKQQRLSGYLLIRATNMSGPFFSPQRDGAAGTDVASSRVMSTSR